MVNGIADQQKCGREGQDELKLRQRHRALKYQRKGNRYPKRKAVKAVSP
jgi:hypothetical protein